MEEAVRAELQKQEDVEQQDKEILVEMVEQDQDTLQVVAVEVLVVLA